MNALKGILTISTVLMSVVAVLFVVEKLLTFFM